METKDIHEKMHELEALIDYKFNDIEWLSKAMRSAEIGRGSCKKRRFSNDTLALVGDAVLKTLWADYLYPEAEHAGNLTQRKESLESNKTLKAIMDAENLRIYTYNDERFYTAEQKILKNKEAKHDPYIEAIAGAIYYDKGFDAAKQWWKRWLFPLTEKHKKQ